MDGLIKEGNIEFEKIDRAPYKYFSKEEADLLMPLLRYINYDLGLKTVSACCGHNYRAPYVNIEMSNETLERLLGDRYTKFVTEGVVLGTGEKVKNIHYFGEISILYTSKKRWAIFRGLKSSFEGNNLVRRMMDFYNFEKELINILSNVKEEIETKECERLFKTAYIKIYK